MSNVNRRNFLRQSTLGTAALALPPFTDANAKTVLPLPATDAADSDMHQPLDLSPAKWIWYPSTRCLQNTCLLFRKEFALNEPPTACTGWLLGESRYKLFVNGKYVQFGPAPSDPRWSECDPLDAVVPLLQKGKNVLAVQVLYFGQGDGTWPIGKPGFIFKLDVKTANQTTQIISDSSWQTHLARSWKPGQYKRWYLRALQEERDNRLYPEGWMAASFSTNKTWKPAMEVKGRADKPAICNGYNEYQWEIFGAEKECALRQRSVPLLQENFTAVEGLKETAWLRWDISPEEYFEGVPDGGFAAEREAFAPYQNGECTVPVKEARTAVLTFALPEQAVGWPLFSIDAPEGTVVELLVHEAHAVGGPALMNSHFHSWTRFICKEGLNELETFDFESFRWLQLHVRNYNRPVKVSGVGIRRRMLPWPQKPVIEIGDEKIQSVMNASLNTIYNSAQETIVDGMGRERQQYSGDCGHQLHTIFSSLGETRLPARYVNTYGQGMTLSGFFFDSWPAYDRLARVMERQLGLTEWGPILDHSVGFCFDCWYYYLYTGDTTALKETFPRLLQFFTYLQTITLPDGLLPVENIGLPSVWIDHEAYQKQRHKQCAFNLYAAAMCGHALAPLCEVFGQTAWAKKIRPYGEGLRRAVVKHFWSAADGCFVNNLPWLSEEKGKRFCDRSLATAVLFDQAPAKQHGAAVKKLKELPPDTGLSYPANAVWRLWALVKMGEMATVLDELRGRWHDMQSVGENNTLQEFWVAQKDAHSQWSHCPVSPGILAHTGIAGIWPLRPGYEECSIRPQVGDLKKVHIVTHTVKGAIVVKSEGEQGKRELTVEIPAGVKANLILPAQEVISLPKKVVESGLATYRVEGPRKVELTLQHF